MEGLTVSSNCSLTEPCSFAPSGSWAGKYVGVLDGDTILVMYGKPRVRIELYGIDAPDTKQTFGTQATAYTKRFALGKQVKVFTEGFDSRGRSLAWIFKGKACMNSVMVRDGFAWWDRTNARYEHKLSLLEQSAKKSRKGLWKNQKAMAPWSWRAQF